ncbi:MAG: six-hairpin glycosidase-like protein [Bacteroidota bacterium]
MGYIFRAAVQCLLISCCFLQLTVSFGQSAEKRWAIGDSSTISWNPTIGGGLPHSDNIEMAGRRVAAIVSYALDSVGMLSVEREVFFPQLHPYIKSNDPSWFIYRAYVKRTFKDEVLPKIYIGDRQWVPGPVERIHLDSELSIEHQVAANGVVARRTFFPSMRQRLFVEQFILENTSDSVLNVQFARHSQNWEDIGADGVYQINVSSDVPATVELQPGDSFQFHLKIAAKRAGEPWPKQTGAEAARERQAFLRQIGANLQLETPDSVLNTLFEFSKIRASENIFDSKLGLIHSPGGGRYYVGIWANDQAEYINPFFPFLGYDVGNESALNTFRAFAAARTPDYQKIRYAFEIEGLVPPFQLDRGDAAMIAYGASQYALALGEEATAEEVWPLIEWCLEYCHRQLNGEGVVRSESDEMEGRIETGDANLSTSSLYYGALDHAADLALALGKDQSVVDVYQSWAAALSKAIEQYFGATVEGLATYRYYKGHRYLRHWICLPLVVGLHDRKEGTIEALFERLWSENGVHVEKNSENEAISKIFWDRGTLYALRGTFLAGATDVSLEKLQQFSSERLLGDRVPYVVEAFPEGDMAHLSAESGLYCRVFTEGLFGIKPTGFDRFECRPLLPKGWDQMALRKIRAFGRYFDLEVSSVNGRHQVQLIEHLSGKILATKTTDLKEPISFQFK